MYPFFGPPVQPPFGPPSHFPFPPTYMQPFAQQMVRPPGLLARLFGGAQAKLAAGSGGIDFGTILTNTQRMLQLTNQAVPLIRQYGPIVRNLPTIWRIMREPDLEEEELVETVTLVDDVDGKTVQKQQQKTIDGLPLPKLYI